MKEMYLFCFITNVTLTILCCVLFAILPSLTRKSLLFGVRIPESAQEHSEAQSIRSTYITVCVFGMCLILVLVVAQYLFWPSLTPVAVMYFPLPLMAVQFLAFIPCWKRAVRLKERCGWTVSDSSFAELRSSHTRGNLSAVPWWYYILSLVLILLSVVVIFTQYEKLPDPMPVHYNINMEPDRWEAKSPWVLLLMPLINIGTLLLMALVAVWVEKAKLQIDQSRPALSFAQHRAYRRLMGHGLGIVTIGVAAGLIIGSFMVLPGVVNNFWLLLVAMLVLIHAACVPLVVVSLRAGQGGCKLKPRLEESDAPAPGYESSYSGVNAKHGRGDDRFWALGMFYHNPDDPSIIVEDRFGTNFGFNYSRTSVKIGITLFLTGLVAMYIFVTPIMLTL